MATARASVLVGPGVVEAQDVPVFDPEPGGVLLSVVAGGVCGTDLHMYRGMDFSPHDGAESPFPVILGHEGIGRIEALGEGVTTDFASEPVTKGDLVYWVPMKRCNRCYTCTVLDDTPCENAEFFAKADQPNWASYTESAWLPRDMAFYKVPEGASVDAILALGCALPTSLGGLDVAGGVKFDDTVVIQGAGPVGLAGTLVAAASGAREIIVIDKFENRLERARQLGATATLSLDDTTAEERKKDVYALCGHTGPNIVLEAAGYLPAFPEGIDLAGQGGTYVSVGLWGATGEVPVSPRQAVLKNLRIRGAQAAKPSSYYRALHLAARMADQKPLAELITHRYSIDNAEQALLDIEAGRPVKALIDINR